MLWMFQRVNYGPVSNEENRRLRDLTVREAWVLVPILAVAVLMGVLPGLFLHPMEASVRRLVGEVQQEQPVRVDGAGAVAMSAREGRATR
jgi:NADH-quinone oxidoreductase subunit M